MLLEFIIQLVTHLTRSLGRIHPTLLRTRGENSPLRKSKCNWCRSRPLSSRSKNRHTYEQVQTFLD